MVHEGRPLHMLAFSHNGHKSERKQGSLPETFSEEKEELAKGF